MIGHVSGVPLEELLAAVLAVGSGLLLAVTTPLARLRRPRGGAGD